MTGVDAGAEAIGVARAHAAASGLAIDYRVADVETLAAEGERFDAVLALEIVEHVADRDRFLRRWRNWSSRAGSLSARR